MKVLVLNWLDRENPQAGGAEIHLHETFGRLASWGHEVTVLVSGWPGAPERARLDGLDIHRTGGRISFTWKARPYFRRRLRGRGFDVVVEDLNKVPLFAPLWTSAPVALLVHHLFGRTAYEQVPWPMATATWLLERPVPRVFRGCPTVAVSRSTAEDLAARGLDAAKITVIPNGVDLQRYRPSPDVDEFPEPTLLYLGRLKRYKRVDLVIRAVDELRSRGISCRLVIAGKGDEADALRDLVSELRLGDRVELAGFVSEERKVELFRRAWVHLLTSSKEGWGIANLEAAACGTPSVASDAPGLRESVRDGETGYLVPHGDVSGLADRTALLLGDPERRRRMGRNAREFAEGFSWDATARRMASFLEEVAAGGGAS